MHKEHKTIQEIPKRKYEGYIWGSDDKEPKVYYGKEEVNISTDDIKGYIIEGLLYCEQDNTSLIIRHSGKYHIYEYDLNNLLEGAELVNTEYLPHRLDGIEKVCFKQLWLPEEDPNCVKLKVLKMKALVFTGFNNCKKQRS